MWIGNEVVIGNTANANYSMEDWNKVYASIKVNVTGDFNEKELNQSAPESCFATRDNGDGTVTLLGFAPTVAGETSGEAAEGCLSENFVIPGTINGKRVTSIGYKAFAVKLSNVSSVTIPNSVTTIGDYAFFRNQLTSVEIGNSVTTIGDYAFSENQLISVVIPNSVTTIGYQAFSYNQLTSVEIPNSVTHLSGFNNNKLTSVEIPNSVTTIGGGAFSTNQLTSVVIPNSVTTIGEGAFFENQLTSVEIPNSVTTIGDGAFQGNQLTSVEIPNSVTTIGDSAFRSNQLTSVTIGNGITSIEFDAFSKSNDTYTTDRVTYYNNPNLSRITIDKSCNDIKNAIGVFGKKNCYPWLSNDSPYIGIGGVTIYGSNNEVCDTF